MDFRFNFAKNAAEHYLALLNELNVQYVMGGDGIQSVLAAFDTEIDQIHEAQLWATGHSETYDEAARLVENFADYGADLLLLRMPLEQYKSWLETALKAAQKLRLRRAESVHCGNLGIVHRRMNNFDGVGS